ncbi:MAG: cyclic pyranopterin monophosphate synthase MoaC [Puniceicoccaceae bacterium]|nr:MAG: cyclic pyranopterin monophosphate synthase MoaC [Puniceicoccaceae bacterium]
MTSPLSHLDDQGRARMVNVGEKPPRRRSATAAGRLTCAPKTIALLRAGDVPKGDVIAVARIAGIQAAKRCSDLIPLCHLVPLHEAKVDFTLVDDAIEITATARTVHQTGVEMEALTAVSVAGLTLYDMLKAVDKGMRLEGIHLVAKEKA